MGVRARSNRGWQAGEHSTTSGDGPVMAAKTAPMVEINVFRNAPDAETLEPGEVLFREGDPGDVTFAVAEGNVTLSVDGTIVEDVGPGGILGELALIDSAPRSATATASASTRVVRVNEERFSYLVHEHPTFALQVMTVMADRLRRANHQHT